MSIRWLMGCGMCSLYSPFSLFVLFRLFGRFLLGNFYSALVTDHEPMDPWFSQSLNDLHVVSKDASFQSDANILNPAIAKDDAVFHFALSHMGVVADGRIGSDK